MEKSFGAVLLLLAATAVVITALGLGFAAASASSDPLIRSRRCAGCTKRRTGATRARARAAHCAEINEMHAQMSARLSEEGRALHDRMHDSCSDHTDERNEI